MCVYVLCGVCVCVCVQNMHGLLFRSSCFIPSLSAEVFIEFIQPSFSVIEGEPVVFLTLLRSGISYINIHLNLTTSPESATG